MLQKFSLSFCIAYFAQLLLLMNACFCMVLPPWASVVPLHSRLSQAGDPFAVLLVHDVISHCNGVWKVPLKWGLFLHQPLFCLHPILNLGSVGNVERMALVQDTVFPGCDIYGPILPHLLSCSELSHSLLFYEEIYNCLLMLCPQLPWGITVSLPETQARKPRVGQLYLSSLCAVAVSIPFQVGETCRSQNAQMETLLLL